MNRKPSAIVETKAPYEARDKVTKAIETIEEFIKHLWSGVRDPARLYIQETDLPLILTMAGDGTYVKAMSSIRDMEDFVDYLSNKVDNSRNMDW